MSRGLVNGVLLLLFVGVVGLNLAMRPDPQVPNLEFLPEMVRTPRFNAFSANPDLPGGGTLQPPVPGSIPRGARRGGPLHFTASPDDALRAGATLENPVREDEAALERGAFVYQNFCQTCHGTGGSGNGLVPMRGFPAPPSLLAARALQMKDGQMFHVVTFGQGNMASYAAQLSREDRWRVIAFIRQLQKTSAPASGAGVQP